MKNLIICSMLVTMVMTACTNQETAMDEVMKPIAFRASMEKNTKAPIDGSIFPTTESFGVFAFHKTGADYDYTKPYINDGYMFYTKNVWSTNPPVYWPLMGTLKFIAYGTYQASAHDYMLGGVGYSPTNGLTFTGVGILDKSATAIQFQYDLMYSDEASDLTYTTASLGVPLVFRHALTQVVFAAVSQDATYVVKKIEVLGVVGRGDFKTKPSPQWTPSILPSDVFTYTCYDDATGKTVPIQPAAPVVFDNRLLLIPQSTAGASIRITFDATFNGRTYPGVTRTYPLTGTTWLMNQRVKYTFTFAANEITYTPSVSPWGVEIPGN